MNAFGRIEIEDSRDALYPMAALLPVEKSVKRYRYWNDNQWWGNQGNKPWCVAYAWLHWAEDGPVTHKDVPPPFVSPRNVYTRAQKVDQWPGENYDGTSVRAGAKILQEEGVISAYHWADSVKTMIEAVLEVGPIVVGTRWYEGMSTPQVMDKGKYHMLIPTGRVLGGHAWVITGVNVTNELFRMKNSWSRQWGKKGRAHIAFDDMETLLSQGGEACLATEIN